MSAIATTEDHSVAAEAACPVTETVRRTLKSHPDSRVRTISASRQGKKLVLGGEAGTWYALQLAQHAALPLVLGLGLELTIGQDLRISLGAA